MQQCGFCSMVSGLLRRAMCVGSRRGSSEAYYKELGDQDTLKIEDGGSEVPEDYSLTQNLAEEMDSMHFPYKSLHRHTYSGRFLTMHKRRRKRLITRSLRKETALLDDIQPGQIQCILNQSVLWRFNAFTLENVSGGRSLPVLCLHLFHWYGLLSHFDLDVARVWKLFNLIDEGYHSTNPYHNSVHAADVTQAMHCFLQQKQIREYLEPLEIMASLIGAVAHDVDHPGVNQPFLIATSNHLAALYENTSVLENHHWRSAVGCLLESGVAEQLTSVHKQLQSQISSLILATDITRQQEFLAKFKQHLDGNIIDMRKSEDRHFILQIALKCADISNPCRPWDISHKWSLKICEEFFRQGDYERKLNLPLTALFDRHSTTIPKIQTGFFKFVVTPLVNEWDRFLQTDLSNQMIKNLKFNQNKWESLVQEELANEISEANEEIEEEADKTSLTNVSDTIELLIPLRRNSLATSKASNMRYQLRRFSVPLNIFQDYKLKNKENQENLNDIKNCGKPDCFLNLHSQLSISKLSNVKCSKENVSCEKNLPEPSNTYAKNLSQANHICSILREPSWKLLRQQTFPPLESVSHSEEFPRQKLLSHKSEDRNFNSLETSKTDIIHNLRGISKCKDNMRISNTIIKNEFKKTDSIGCGSSCRMVRTNEQNNALVDILECTGKLDKENFDPSTRQSIIKRRESAPVGSQFRDSNTSFQMQPVRNELLSERRRSVPMDSTNFGHNEKIVKDTLPSALNSNNGKDLKFRRRGSAPIMVASDTKSLNYLTSAMQNITTNWSRKQSSLHHTSASNVVEMLGPTAALWHQWLCKTRYEFQEKPLVGLRRRGSLPVEVLTVTGAVHHH